MLSELEPLATSLGAYAFAVGLGLLWGSFANVCIYRWPPTDEHPKGRSVVAPGSHCFACKAPVRWYDNVPLLSYLWLRGRCRDCKAEFSPRYLVVEALTGALFGVAWWFAVVASAQFEPLDARLVRFGIDAAFIVVMVIVAFIDLDTKLILRGLMVPATVVFYALGLCEHRPWLDGLIGAAVGYGVPWLIGEIYFRVTGREGLGLGDSDLLMAVGALLGWRGVVVSLFGGSIVGSIIGVAAIAAARARAKGRPDEPSAPADEPAAPEDDEAEPSLMKTELPFGPFLAVAAVFFLFAEPWIELRFRL